LGNGDELELALVVGALQDLRLDRGDRHHTEHLSVRVQGLELIVYGLHLKV
jgi:hypothetical protein